MAVLQYLATQAYEKFGVTAAAAGYEPQAIDWDSFFEFIEKIFELFANCGLFANIKTRRILRICHEPSRRHMERGERILATILPKEDLCQIGGMMIDATAAVLATIDEDTLVNGMAKA